MNYNTKYRSCASFVFAVLCVYSIGATGFAQEKQQPRIATFTTEVTCPIGHPLIAGLRAPAKKIIDPLYARGFVLLGAEQPIVLCAIDWCEIRNQSYDLWRDALAKAAGTRRERVLVCCLHQHDAPLSDIGAEKLLAKAGLGGSMFDPKFERVCIARTAKALKRSLRTAQPISHIGIGQAKINKIASNRRVVLANKSVTYNRSSASGGNKTYRDAPDGLIDPWLKTISFWNGNKRICNLHSYATHPMSYYGRGGVTADFVGIARDLMQRTHRATFQMYVSGCSGDVTAGKYNSGAPDQRKVLANRLFAAMKQADQATKKYPVVRIKLRSTKLTLQFRPTKKYTQATLQKTLNNAKAPLRNRILAAMGLASRQRVANGQPIDFPCLDLGKAKIVLFPGEAFVGYQLAAQKQQPNSFVLSIGYGECWPGYIPTTQGFRDNFDDVWYWVAPDSAERMQRAINTVLPKSTSAK